MNPIKFVTKQTESMFSVATTAVAIEALIGASRGTPEFVVSLALLASSGALLLTALTYSTVKWTVKRRVVSNGDTESRVLGESTLSTMLLLLAPAISLFTVANSVLLIVLSKRTDVGKGSA